MAVGWAQDGAVQKQIDAGIEDAVEQARKSLPRGKSKTHCMECGKIIPEARRKAIIGVSLCIECQSSLEKQQTISAGFNRRGNKDSQLK